jgi:hypothetical protein
MLFGNIYAGNGCSLFPAFFSKKEAVLQNFISKNFVSLK